MCEMAGLDSWYRTLGCSRTAVMKGTDVTGIVDGKLSTTLAHNLRLGEDKGSPASLLPRPHLLDVLRRLMCPHRTS